MPKKKRKSAKKAKEKPPASAKKPFYFLSYSTGEPQVEFFVECLEIVFGDCFTLERTPGALDVGGSQYDAIVDRIQNCVFGVVCLDGLRPNVVFEYGALVGAGKVVLPFKERAAAVDIPHLYNAPEYLDAVRPAIKLDAQFSNTKDRYTPSWNRFELQKTVSGIWKAYVDRAEDITGYVEILEPKL